MDNLKRNNKMTELAIKQNLLLWQVSQSLLEIKDELVAKKIKPLDPSKNSNIILPTSL